MGFAISDASRTLARPLATITIEAGGDGAERAASEVRRLAAQDDGVLAIVVGLPKRLDGSPSGDTAYVEAFIEALRAKTGVQVVAEDERLTSREAESRLAIRERDWKRRKERLDAAAAAIILQDYLDRQPR